MGRKNCERIEYPCGTCEKDCEVGSPPAVLCGDCNLWYHAACQQQHEKSKEIIGDIFGENGILSCEDEYEFELAGFELEEKYNKCIPKFLPYFVRLSKSLLEFVFLPSKKKQMRANKLEKQLVRKHEPYFETFLRLESSKNDRFN